MGSLFFRENYMLLYDNNDVLYKEDKTMLESLIYKLAFMLTRWETGLNPEHLSLSEAFVWLNTCNRYETALGWAFVIIGISAVCMIMYALVTNYESVKKDCIEN